MEFRLIFDTIPEQFDRYRPRYCPELFADLIGYAQVGRESRVLEIGPGTGQATDPILETGCEYHAIELGGHLCEKMREKYGRFPNFHLVNGDFVTHDFGAQRFDLIYSAAAIQWIPEAAAYSRAFRLLRPGGVLAMMLTQSDYRSPNEALYDRIQRLYALYYKPEIPYRQGSFGYENAPAYGFSAVERRDYHGRRVMDPDEYVSYCGTHCDHLTIPDRLKLPFFEGLRNAVAESGGKIVFEDTHVLYLTRKPPEEQPVAGCGLG